MILDTYASHTQRLGVLASPSDAVAYYIHTVVLRALGWHLSWYLESILGQSSATLTIGVSLAAVFSWVVATQGRQVRVFTLTAVLTGSGYTVLAAEITTYAVREAPFLSPIGFQWRLACAGWLCELRVCQVDESDGGWPVVAGAVVAWCLDGIGAGPPALDDAGIGAAGAAGVEVLLAGDLGPGAGEEFLSLRRGERPGRRPGG